MLLNFTYKNNKLGLAILKCVKNNDWPSSSQTSVQLAALQFILQRNLCPAGGRPLCASSSSAVKYNCGNGACLREVIGENKQQAHTKSLTTKPFARGLGEISIIKACSCFSHFVWTDENFTADSLVGTVSLGYFQALF